MEKQAYKFYNTVSSAGLHDWIRYKGVKESVDGTVLHIYDDLVSVDNTASDAEWAEMMLRANEITEEDFMLTVQDFLADIKGTCDDTSQKIANSLENWPDDYWQDKELLRIMRIY